MFDRQPAAGPGLAGGDGYTALRAELAELAAEDAADLRVPWLRALAALIAGDVTTARVEFEAVRRALPGEAAPQLAVGLCAELLGDPASAARHYASVWRTDRGYVSAAFGLARSRCAVGDPAGAIEALAQVPRSSAHSTAAALCALQAGEPREGLDEQLAPAYFAVAERLNEAHPEPHRDRRAAPPAGDRRRAHRRARLAGARPVAGRRRRPDRDRTTCSGCR